MRNFAAHAQDPFYAAGGTLSPDVHAEHIYNSLVEAEYLIDTRQDWNFSTLESQELIEMLVLGKSDT